MLKPNYIEAKKRTKEDIKVLRNEYKIPDEVKNLGENKKYFIGMILYQLYMTS